MGYFYWAAKKKNEIAKMFANLKDLFKTVIKQWQQNKHFGKL